MKNLLIILSLMLAFNSCRLEEATTERHGPLYIVTTTGIIEDCVSNIVKDSCEVTALMGPGTDPHIYKPTPGDIELLDEADVIIANGLHLEGKMAEMLEKYGKEKPVLFVSDGLEESNIVKSADFEDAYDPHIWFDQVLWMNGLSYVTDELGKIDTISKEYFRKNFLAYQSEVMETSKELSELINQVPEQNRILITSHDAFSYFGRYYGIEVKGIQGISTLSEVGLKEVADMVDFVIEHEVKSIFIETSTSDKTAHSIIDGCKDKGYELKIDGPLYSDALGEPHTDAGTYIGMLRANAETISGGLK